MSPLLRARAPLLPHQATGGEGSGGARRTWRSRCSRYLLFATIAGLLAWGRTQPEDGGTQGGATASTGTDFYGRPRVRNESSASCRAHALGSKPSLDELAALGRPLPAYMLTAVNGDPKKALRRWVETLRWRCDIGDEEVFRHPNPLFERILPYYPTYLHLPDREGRLTYWELIGGIDQAAIERDHLTRDDIVANYIWSTLFTWDVAARDDKHEVTIVVDMTDFGLAHITPTVLSIFKRVANVLRTHFPCREYGTFFINAPAWWATCYRLVAPMVSQAQRNKVRVIHGKEASQELLHSLIDPANLPPEYGGTGPRLGAAPLEIQKRELALGRALPG